MFKFPYTNLHELNLDWILSVVKDAVEIFKNGEADIQHAVETSEQALETAEEAAQGVVADGAVTIPKLNDDVLKMFAFVVSGRVNDLPIPKDSFVVVRLSTIPSVSDGLYQAVADIPANTMLTDLDLKQPADLGNGATNVLQQLCNAIESGLLNIVDGDTASSGVPAGGLAFIKNNEHGLATGFYTNSSGSTFPTSGGTADSSAFTRVFDVLNSLRTALNSLSSDVGGLETALGRIKSYYGETSGSVTDVVFQTGTFTFGFLIGYYRSSDQSANRSGYAIVFVYNNTAYITQKTGLAHVTSATYNNGVLTVSASYGYTNYNLIVLG